MNNGKVLCRMPAHNGQRVTTVQVDVDNMQLPPLTSIYKCNANAMLIPTSRSVSLDT